MPQVGDFAIVRDVGARGATMPPNYNSRPLIPEIMLEDVTLTVIRKRQPIEHLLNLEVQGGRSDGYPDLRGRNGNLRKHYPLDFLGKAGIHTGWYVIGDAKEAATQDGKAA
jgi:hypothetical protein